MGTLSKRLTAGLLVFALALAVAVAPALAQDPYGPTTTTTAPAAVLPSCSLSAAAAVPVAPGTPVTATASNVPRGQTVQVLFGGDEVGRGTAEGGTPTAVSVDFVVPNRPPGEYLVTAVGATFTAQCRSETGGTVMVLGATQRQGGGSGGSGGSLAKTGIYVGLFVAVAGALILAGRGFVSESTRRRRRTARAGL